jgi:hypothetical protein
MTLLNQLATMPVCDFLKSKDVEEELIDGFIDFITHTCPDDGA